MKLLELYEDLFQYVCRLNRVARTSSHPEFARVRSEVRDLLDQVQRNTANDVRLANQVKRLELPVIFFLDNLICSSPLQFAAQWAEKRLASDHNELAGDERFFDLLEADLGDPGEDAAERLAVFYSCLGLGFTGMYLSQPGKLRQYMEQIFPRIRQWVDSDPRAKITDDTYRSTNTQVLTEPPSRKMVLVVLIFVFVSFSVLITYYGLYARAVNSMTDAISLIIKQDQGGR